MPKPKKQKGWFNHAHNNTNTNRGEVEYTDDHGPAHVEFAFDESSGAEIGPDGLTRFSLPFSRQYAYKSFDNKVEVLGNDDAPSINGVLVVSSRTEEFSVHEIVIAPPRLRAVYASERDARVAQKNAEKLRSGEEISESRIPVWVSIIQGPCLVSVKSCTVDCPLCGKRVFPVRKFIADNTDIKTINYEKDGKKLTRVIKIAKDDGAEIKGIKDLEGHACVCPQCHSDIEKIYPKYWTLEDRALIPSKSYGDSLVGYLKAEISDFNQGRSKNMADVLPKIYIGDTEWNEAMKAEVKLSSKPVLVVKNFATFTVQDAQELRDLSFGNKDEKRTFWGQFGFKPRGIPKPKPKPGNVTWGEHFDLDGICG